MLIEFLKSITTAGWGVILASISTIVTIWGWKVTGDRQAKLLKEQTNANKILGVQNIIVPKKIEAIQNILNWLNEGYSIASMLYQTNSWLSLHRNDFSSDLAKHKIKNYEKAAHQLEEWKTESPKFLAILNSWLDRYDLGTELGEHVILTKQHTSIFGKHEFSQEERENSFLYFSTSHFNLYDKVAKISDKYWEDN